MMTIDILVTEVSGLRREDVERWVDNEWVRPDREGGRPLFQDIDVARVRLIQALRDEMAVNEEALPVVLSLLDQLYEVRRRMRELTQAIDRTASPTMRQKLARHLSKAAP